MSKMPHPRPRVHLTQWLFGAACCALAISLLVAVTITTQDDAQANQTQPVAVDQMTLSKLADVEVQEFPWGTIRWTMNSQIDAKSTMTFGVVYIKPQQTNALHLHPKADEILHVVEGSCEHRMGDKWVKMKVGDTIRIPHGIAHNARTLDEACRVVVVYDTGQRKMIPVEEDTK